MTFPVDSEEGFDVESLVDYGAPDPVDDLEAAELHRIESQFGWLAGSSSREKSMDDPREVMEIARLFCEGHADGDDRRRKQQERRRREHSKLTESYREAGLEDPERWATFHMADRHMDRRNKRQEPSDA